ncbi:unnamed protein product [Candidatus Paraburkholderia kirkii UZHbot1]|uniref:WGS project CAFE00000000 data, contig bkir_c151 n=1 Tax=Candidatus Paraburkholderia kirkii UZHbot1 TaxID=1055526 RepID=U3UAJ0_9BURK|nr:unnamed protein product [Candidatus Paraburkholderia kirkii UZHbot1]
MNHYKVKPVAGDEETVRVFFLRVASFQETIFSFFKNLEATMPKPKTFECTLLVNKGDRLAFALSFLAVEKYYPAYIHNFMEASFIGAQDLGISTVNWAGIDRIGKAAHVPVSVPLLKQHEAALRADLASFLTLQKDLQVTNTPAVSVAGTYIVTPEFTNGDAQLFSQLVNGIISMAC